MSAVNIIVNIFHILFAVSLIAVVLLQSGKQAGLSGSIAGGAETFFGKNKGRTIDALLSKYTTVAAVLFLVTSIALELLINR
ncbi:MAG TPA: preprotein translocase subunit SecG [Pseudobacteroides sp.]|uniref:preprotein translocase subunit SecG n=1 Tax=Pseudobacteroides sp. TaxID=1968840 RepID=UPI002F957409